MLNFIIKTKLILIFTFINTDIVNEFEKNNIKLPIMELIYDNIWGTIYHAEESECDSSPTITGDGSHINTLNASNHRWIAISQDMLNLPKGLKMLKDSSINIFKGKLSYGDTVWIESPYLEINGWWIIHDAKHPRVKKSIDFLQTKGDGNLYKNNRLWPGKFYNIKICKLYGNQYNILKKIFKKYL